MERFITCGGILALDCLTCGLSLFGEATFGAAQAGLVAVSAVGSLYVVRQIADAVFTGESGETLEGVE